MRDHQAWLEERCTALRFACNPRRTDRDSGLNSLGWSGSLDSEHRRKRISSRHMGTRPHAGRHKIRGITFKRGRCCTDLWDPLPHRAGQRPSDRGLQELADPGGQHSVGRWRAEGHSDFVATSRIFFGGRQVPGAAVSVGGGGNEPLLRHLLCPQLVLHETLRRQVEQGSFVEVQCAQQDRPPGLIAPQPSPSIGRAVSLYDCVLGVFDLLLQVGDRGSWLRRWQNVVDEPSSL